MSNQVFPIDLPGIDIKVRRRVIFKTKVMESASGKELRGRFQETPRYGYRLRFNFLRSDPPLQELQQLVTFFEDHCGQWDSFLLDEPAPYNTQRRVRFAKDDMDTERFLIHVWELKSLELISVK